MDLLLLVLVTATCTSALQQHTTRSRIDGVDTQLLLDSEGETVMDSEEDLGYQMTTVYARMEDRSPLFFDNTLVINIGDKVSSYKRYSGFAARTGDTVGISCRLDRLVPRMVVNRFLTDENMTSPVVANGRISRVEDYNWINVTIHNATLNDSGSYICEGDHKALTIIEPSNPPKILDYQCVSYRFLELTCTLQTNTKKYDLVNWRIRWSTRETRNCGDTECIDQEMDEIQVIPASSHSGYDTIICKIKGWIFKNVTYDINVTGSNPFVTGTTNLSTRLASPIAMLAPPSVNRHNVTTNCITLQVTPYKRDMHMARVGAPGFIEHVIYSFGIRYEITVRREGPEDRSLFFDKEEPRLIVLTDNEATSRIYIPDLLPNTKYQIRVRNQMNNTINPNIWSNSTNYTATTSDARPVVAPDISPYSFTLSESIQCPDNREATFHWKGVSEVSGKGNGVITSYTIYKIEGALAERDMITYEITSPGNLISGGSISSTVKTVEGNNRSVSICVNESRSTFGIVPVNSAGTGIYNGLYYVPQTSDMIPVWPCDISVRYYDKSETLEVDWSVLPRENNYTVFWCQVDFDNECSTGKEIERQEMMPSHLGFSIGLKLDAKYKFGLSAHSGKHKSSGIIWAECIDRPDKELKQSTAKLSIQMNGLEASIRVDDPCTGESRRAESYTVKSCLYSKETMRCVKEEQRSAVDLCMEFVKISLNQHSESYGFWVVSHAGDLTVESVVVIKWTGRKELTWEIAIVVIFSSLLVVGVTLCLVYCAGQRKRVQRYKNPQLVLPAQLMVEPEFSETDDEDSEESSSMQSVFRSYLIKDQTFTPLTPVYKSDVHIPLTKLYENNCEGMETDVERCGSDCYPRTLSYQPTMSNQSGTIDYKKGLISGATLPDEYLRCDEVDCELSLSAQIFYGSDTGGTQIDLAEFLNDSGSAKLNKPNHRNLVCENQRNAKLMVNLDSNQNEEEESKLLRVDIDRANQRICAENMVTSNTETSPTSINTDITRADALNDTKETEDNESQSLTRLMDVAENSSGDSGYVCRHIGETMGLRSNSLTSNESQSNHL